jgi:hypothetical protein
MNLFSSSFLRAAALAAALPLLGASATVQINGVCVNGSCSPTPVTYGAGNNQTGSTYNGITVGSDAYATATSFGVGVAADGSTYINFYPAVAYVGSAPSTSADTVTVNLLASIYDAAASNWNGTYTEHVPLIVATGSSASGELYVDGQGVGLVGPYGAGTWDVSNSATLTGITGSTLNYSFDFIFTFAPGTLPGAASLSPTPEPATLLPAALGLMGFGLMAFRRRTK